MSYGFARVRVAALALALALSGCGLAGEPVQLVTGVPPIARGSNGEVGCFLDFAVGQLASDPTYGTTITDETAGAPTPLPAPVAWRPGFTARRVNGEVVVRDPTGTVVATTGHRYKIVGGYAGGSADWPEMPTRVFWACGYVDANP
jgi:hypothetical protein